MPSIGTAAHDSGIVHRDVKPENLFITTDERVKILDFGVVKLTRANDDDPQPGLSTETDPGVVVGTSAYASPEQIRGGMIDHRSDLFSLGTVLHEMLPGRPAFARATAAETLAAIGCRRCVCSIGSLRNAISNPTRCDASVRTSIPWSPDGAWVVIGGTEAGSPGLYKIPAGGGKPVKLVDGQVVNPIWSPDGRMIVYNGPIIAGLSTLLGVRPDGVAVAMSPVKVRPGGQRFLPDGKGVVYQSALLDFHLLELASGSTRQLTQFKFTTPLMSGRRFDVTPDGSAIVFDRSSENSDVVLIELPR